MTITTVGLDLAKNVFQVHGIDAAGDVIVRRRLHLLDLDLPVWRDDATAPRAEPGVGDEALAARLR